MSATQTSIKSLFNATLKGIGAAGQLRASFASAIKAACKGEDDKAGRTSVRAELRKACGLPASAPKREKGADGKQTAKSQAENLFDVTFHRACGDVWPKPKAAKVAKEVGTKASKEGAVAKGISQRVAAYALVLQDVAQAKTEGKLSKTEAAALDKLLGKMKAIAELA